MLKKTKVIHLKDMDETAEENVIKEAISKALQVNQDCFETCEHGSRQDRMDQVPGDRKEARHQVFPMLGIWTPKRPMQRARPRT
ncbi:hypothetical protein QE152_g33069 [Popillia japonica]|uniref:Uncharacterized protein n=1 Tax=Popillia japonica TaxID=7064 RepID=A0AAW1IYB4_POPJA